MHPNLGLIKPILVKESQDLILQILAKQEICECIWINYKIGIEMI